jgi:TRAP-type mannitol/chloroaromatic compound transport system permease small subunit
MRDYRSKRSGDLALSLFSSKELFVSKFIPVAFFLFVLTFFARTSWYAIVWIVNHFVLYDLSDTKQYWLDYTLKDLSEITFYCLCLSLLIPVIVYLIMIRFPSIRRTITCVILSGAIMVLSRLALNYASSSIFRPRYHFYDAIVLILFKLAVVLLFLGLISIAVAPRFKRIFTEG